MRVSISRSQFLSGAFTSVLLFCIGTLCARPAMSQPAPKPAQASAVRSPSDTVREFYKAMREKRFREAFAMSIYKPAIENLKPQEFEDLRPDFDNMAAATPDAVEIKGEQVSGEPAPGFVKVPSIDDTAGQPEPG